MTSYVYVYIYTYVYVWGVSMPMKTMLLNGDHDPQSTRKFVDCPFPCLRSNQWRDPRDLPQWLGNRIWLVFFSTHRGIPRKNCTPSDFFEDGELMWTVQSAVESKMMNRGIFGKFSPQIFMTQKAAKVWPQSETRRSLRSLLQNPCQESKPRATTNVMKPWKALEVWDVF